MLLLLLLLLGIALNLPFVQTKIAHYFTEKLNSDYKISLNVDQVAITVFGGVKLKTILIKDDRKDTLIYAKCINTNVLGFRNILDKKLIFGTIRADNLYFNIKTYKNEKLTNFDKFVAAFDDGTPPPKTKFLMQANEIYLQNAHFIVADENFINQKDVDLKNITGKVDDFKILGPDMKLIVKKLSFEDFRGLKVNRFATVFSYNKSEMSLQNLNLDTENSVFSGAIKMKYKNGDFADFSNKVILNIDAKNAQIGSNDIRFFSNVLAKNQKFNLKSKISGTLNNLYFKKLRLFDGKGTEIVGDLNLKNSIHKPGKGDFLIDATFQKLNTSYNNLIAITPELLKNKLPIELKKLGNFSLIGKTKVSTKDLDADFSVTTNLGFLSSKIIMKNFDDDNKVSYKGNVVLQNFDLGTLLDQKKIGKTTLNLDVDGIGFTEKSLNTSVSGTIKNFNFNNYNFQNIRTTSNFKKPFFDGKVTIDDPNLKMSFDGIVNLNKQNSSFDFVSKVDFANLKNLNLIDDKVSIFKGKIDIKATGNSFENAVGNIILTDASYQNTKENYQFELLTISSSFNQNKERIIALDSPNNIKGEIQGKFDFSQIQTMIQNSLGSLYTNFKLDKLKKGQFLKFNFSDFNKIIEILNPNIKLSENAIVNGSINGDTNDFKFNFLSKKVTLFDNLLDNVSIEIDNKNPLYNAYIQIDSIQNKNYKIRDFSLINVTSKDTLSFRTEFKGGNRGEDVYNLNMYHSIDKNNQNVIGFNKSEVTFNDYLWIINEAKNDKNKITFDKSFTNFYFEDLLISHENQSILLKGSLKGSKDKDLQLTFKDVNLSKITPSIEKFKFEGNVNGDVFLKQNNDVYQPTAALDIKQLAINDNKLGDLILDVEGDESFKKFKINSEIENENFKSFKANGNLNIVNDETFIDLDLNFQKFNLGILSNLGGEVISNIRGFASGNARLDGNVKNIDYNGRLFVDETGLTIPYLGVDYLLKPNSIIDITQTKFIIQPTVLIDSKFKTEANFDGFIKHKQFSDWKLNLNINSKNFLALNSKDAEDAAYYGTAFIDGKASIKGPTSGLIIEMNAKSAKGTYIKIPINQGESVSDNKYIHFLTVKEKYGKQTNAITQTNDYNGLQLNFDLDITQDATIEVILDRNSGHGMKGKGIGTLFMNINTLGKFEMTGDYQIYEGTYNFKYGGLIDKRLKVKKYGSIVWDGDPLKAILNLEAVYQTNANPAVLIDNPSFNKKIPVEVVIGVKGTISTPEPDFNINFPNVSSVLKSEIETKLNDKDIRQTQALYLLSTGGFLSPEGLSQAQVTNSLYEKAGALFGDLFHDESGKFQLDFDYVQAEKNALNPTNGRVGVNITTKINERITINGKVGVPTGGATESAIIGNFEAQYRVNEDGTLNLRLFNRENDINYIGQGIGYTQGLGVSYEVDFDTFNELISKIFKKKVVETSLKNNSDHQDDDLQPDYINFSDKNNSDKKDSNNSNKPNQDAAPKKEED